MSPRVGREADPAGRDSRHWASLWLLEPRSRSRCTRSGSVPSGRAVSTTRRSSVQIFVSDTERTRSSCVRGRLCRSSTSNPGALGNFRRGRFTFRARLVPSGGGVQSVLGSPLFVRPRLRDAPIACVQRPTPAWPRWSPHPFQRWKRCGGLLCHREARVNDDCPWQFTEAFSTAHREVPSSTM